MDDMADCPEVSFVLADLGCLDEDERYSYLGEKLAMLDGRDWAAIDYQQRERYRLMAWTVQEAAADLSEMLEEPWNTRQTTSR